MGKVYLVGAGSGDPELLTLKAYRLLQSADTVIYDRLVNPLILYLTKKSAKLIDVGKSPNFHKKTQEAINELLITEANQNQVVVRLKGGDPAIYGRVGEELKALKVANVLYEIVPGITAASAAASYADIPITQRNIAERVLIMTPRQTLVNFSETNFAQVLKDTTVVLYMGVASLPKIIESLKNQSVAGTMPIAIVENGTRGNQRTFLTTLEKIESDVTNNKINNPALIIIGYACALRTGKSWFERLSKFGECPLIVTDEIPTLEEISEYTSKGCEPWFTVVGKNRQERFNSLDCEKLKQQFSEIVFKKGASYQAFDELKERLEV